MKINCDLGEGLQNIDAQLLPLVDQANIACGAHAGDEDSIRRCLTLAKHHQTEVGIHPSYPDRKHFGRRSLTISNTDLEASLAQQIEVFLAISREVGLHPGYIKAHGALYNDLMQRPDLCDWFFSFIASTHQTHNIKLDIMLSASRYSDEILARASALGLQLIFEAFADRAYLANGALVPRSQHTAVLDKATDIIAQYRQLQQNSEVICQNGDKLKLHVDSVCFHGDNPASVDAILRLRKSNTDTLQ